MLSLVIVATILFFISLTFSMFGKGGGELYVPVILSFLSLSFYEAAAISLFLIFLQSISMVFIYSRRHNLLDWHLAILLAFVVGASSFLGAFLSYKESSFYLKILFAIILLFSSFLLLLDKNAKSVFKFGIWKRKVGNISYEMNAILSIIPVSLAAFLAGMIGISGGGLIVPILIILGGVPLRISMGTNTFLVFVSSSMGFFGHVINGPINWKLCFIFALAIIIGSQIGSHMHVKVKEKHLKYGLSLILSFAAIWMIIKTIFPL